MDQDRDTSEKNASARDEPPSGKKAARIVPFQELSGGASEVLIEHEGQTYQLKTTRNGRLVLNK